MLRIQKTVLKTAKDVCRGLFQKVWPPPPIRVTSALFFIISYLLKYQIYLLLLTSMLLNCHSELRFVILSGTKWSRRIPSVKSLPIRDLNVLPNHFSLRVSNLLTVFPRYRRLYVAKRFKINWFMYIIFLCKTFYYACFMFINPAGNIVCYAYINNFVIFIWHYINIILHGSFNSGPFGYAQGDKNLLGTKIIARQIYFFNTFWHFF